MSNVAVFKARRDRILAKLGNNLAIIFAAPEQKRSNDTFYPYRQDSDFHYLTGFDEPESALLLNGLSGESILFCRDKHPERETWDGFRYGPYVAQSVFGLDAAYSNTEWPEYLANHAHDIDYLYGLWNRYPNIDQQIYTLWGQLQDQSWQGIQAPFAMADLSHIIHPMRLIKDDFELSLLKKAGKISAQAHVKAMQYAKAGQFEYQIEAEILHHFMQSGARDPAYGSIVATGKNACTLHYVQNQDRLENGQLLLIDAGAEYQNYAGDITRTFPVSGRFSPEQKAVYEIVLAANEAVIANCRAGITWQSMGDLAAKILTEGLLDLGLLHGQVDDLLAEKAYRRFYMHGIGHWIGLDVHDVGGRFVDGKPIVLQENMCTTVEPGLYIPDDYDIPEAFRNIGIRIEDNIVIQTNACLVYTDDVPKKVDEIESLMQLS